MESRFTGGERTRGREASTSIIHAGRLLEVPGRAPVTERSLVVRDGAIIAVESGYIAAEGDYEGASIIDLRKHFVMPGLMDMHVHTTMGGGGFNAEGGPRGRAGNRYAQSEADLALNAAIYARKTLEAGFTTVRDLGTPRYPSVAIALRDAIDDGRIPGPRVFAAASYIFATSGHGDLEGHPEPITAALDSDGRCDGVDECRKAVRTQVKRGADVIKFMATGGGREKNGGPDAEPEFFPDEMRAIVDTAHSFGLRVAAHAHGHKGIVAALEAGADTIEHGTAINERAIAAFRRHGGVLVPTLSVHSMILKRAKRRGPEFFKKMEKRISAKHDNIRRALRKGVPIALGTDAGIAPHGENAIELEWYVRLGMTPMQAIEAGTVNAARVLGMEAKLGSLEVGKFADVIAVEGDPLADISVLGDVDFVMKDGVVHRRGAWRRAEMGSSSS